MKVVGQLLTLQNLIYMRTKMNKEATIKNPLVIGKSLGCFNADKAGPVIFLDLKAIEEKAQRITSVLGVELTSEQVAMFTYLHEMTHYKQWKEGRITDDELRNTSFSKSPKAVQLEEEADLKAVEFLLTTKIAKTWKKRTLILAMVGAKKELTPKEARALGIIS